jgi:hypothetical protein
MAAGGSPTNVKLGPGRLYYAPLGTTEPVSSSAALPSAWQAIGYTENGTEIATNITSEDIEVAEEFDPIDNVMTKRSTVVTVEMAESTKKRLLLALGAGASFADDGAVFEMPDADAVVGVMMVWDSDLGTTPTNLNRRILFRSVKPSGNVTTVRRKAPAKSTISATFTAIKPDAANRAVKFFPNGLGQI